MIRMSLDFIHIEQLVKVKLDRIGEQVTGGKQGVHLFK